MIDLSSDTMTKPSPGMLQTMVEAEVGFGISGEDPTVNLLEQRITEMLGKEAALFVPSGTMANQVALLTHTRPGDEVILDREAHVINYEAGGMAALGSVQPFLLDSHRGIIEPEQVEQSVRFPDAHFPPSRLVWLENTHNNGGGAVFPLEKMKAIRNVAMNYNLAVHMNGARLFNASVASGIEPVEYAAQVDSVSIGFSKGLGAPMGSMLMGDKDFITRAHRYRQMLGGMVRKSGILAAAAIYALDNNLKRLGEDHKNAKRLGEGLAEIDGVKIIRGPIETNLVFIDVVETGKNALEIMNEACEQDVLILPEGFTIMRAVTHLGVSAEDIEKTIEVLHAVMKS